MDDGLFGITTFWSIIPPKIAVDELYRRLSTFLYNSISTAKIMLNTAQIGLKIVQNCSNSGDIRKFYQRLVVIYAKYY